MVKSKWVLLVDAHGKPLGNRSRVLLEDEEEEDDVKALMRGAVKQFERADDFQGIASTELRAFASEAQRRAGARLELEQSISELGNNAAQAIVLELPRVRAAAALGVPVAPRAWWERPPPAPLARMTSLLHIEELTSECLKFATQKPGSVYEIPLIHKFMKPLGGCTTTGKIYWREEERQLSLLVRNLPVDKYGHPAKKNVLMGSPGVGKSTLLCILAFCMALVGKNNVLMVRKLKKPSRPVFCLFFLGPKKNGSVEWFSQEQCGLNQAVDVFVDMNVRQDFKTILMLDGFPYHGLHDDLRTFHFLATSQHVSPKSSEFEYVSLFLFPCWRRGDLFGLGKRLYGWEEITVDPETGKDARTGMVERFRYSGGSALEFLCDSIEDLDVSVTASVNDFEGDSTMLLSMSRAAQTGDKQSDRLRRTFIDSTEVMNPQAYCSPEFWKQVVDSEIAIMMLQTKFHGEDLHYLFQWASAEGAAYALLTGLLFEIMVYRLASDNRLQLSTAPVDHRSRWKRTGRRRVEFTQLSMKQGLVLNAEDEEPSCDSELAKRWKTNEEQAYWYPDSGVYKTIDTVVKLAHGGFAYLQLAVSDNNGVDALELMAMNDQLGVKPGEKPKLIFVFPTRQEAEAFECSRQVTVEKAKQACEVHVGFVLDYDFTPRFKW